MIFNNYPFSKKDIEEVFKNLLSSEDIKSYYKGLKYGYKEEETIVGSLDFFFRDGASDGASIDKDYPDSWKKVVNFRKQRILAQNTGNK